MFCNVHFTKWFVFAVSSAPLCLFALHLRPIRADTFVALVVLACFALHAFFSSEVWPWASPALALINIFTMSVMEIAWRLSPWHPLAAFPGPRLCAASNLPNAWMVFSGHRHIHIKKLHRMYGPVVRIGPMSLVFENASAVHDIYTSACALDRSNAYAEVTGGMPGRGLFFLAQRDEHNVRRRLWAGSFGSQAIRAYDQAILARTKQMLAHNEARSIRDGAIDISDVIYHWTFDLIQDFTCGCPRREGMIVHGDTSGFVKQAQLSMAMFDVFTELRWALEILEWFPAIARNPLVPQFAYCKKMMHDRAEHDCGSDHEDFASYWLQERTRSQRHPALTPDDMTLEALLAMQAGLDTVGATFVHMIYFVLSNPAIGERLKEELERNLSDQNTSMDIDSLMQLPYLSAIVEESFRLGSPWHSVPRQVAGQATVIDGFAVPPNTVVGVSSFVMHTSEDNFYPLPEQFAPERWLPGGLGPDSRTARLLTFSGGPFGCPGRAIAKRMLITAAAYLFIDYDVKFASTVDKAQFLEGASHIRAVLFKHPLALVMTRR